MSDFSTNTVVVPSAVGMTKIKAAAMRMCGTALLWVGLAALLYIPTSGGGAAGGVAAVIGFASFAAGLGLFADGLKREIVEELRSARR